MGLGQNLTKPSINVSEMNINLIAIYRGLLGTRLLSRSLYLKLSGISLGTTVLEMKIS